MIKEKNEGKLLWSFFLKKKKKRKKKVGLFPAYRENGWKATKNTFRVLASVSQPFFLYLEIKTTFCFPKKKHYTIDSFNFSYIN
jgi:hypothetical protein